MSGQACYFGFSMHKSNNSLRPLASVLLVGRVYAVQDASATTATSFKLAKTAV